MLNLEVYRRKEVSDLTALYSEGFRLIFAGADTLLIGHWHIMQNPTLLTQLRRETVIIWPDLKTYPSLSGLETLPLIATIKESLRFILSGKLLTRVVPLEDAVISD